MSTVELSGEEQKLLGFARNRKWSEVRKMYKKKELRRVQLIETGDTVLHMAVSSEEVKEVEKMVDMVCGRRTNDRAKRSPPLLTVDENGDDKKLVLGAENHRKDTPLHLAASMGNAKMCKKIGEAEPSLIASRNMAGETPLFLAALSGRKKAFLWLHYLYTEGPGVSSTDFSHCIRDNDDTILHCAIADGHLDVALEIVRLYEKEMLFRRNNDGLSPLHLLATMPSAFESTDLLGRSFVVQLIYPWFFIEKKKQATKKEEVASLPEPEPWFNCLVNALCGLLDYFDHDDEEDGERTLTELIWALILMVCLQTLLMVCSLILMVLGLIFLLPLFILSQPLSLAGFLVKWFFEIPKMKEKHTWSLQIIEQILQHACIDDMLEMKPKSPSETASSSSNIKEVNGSRIVETPLVIAVKNGVVEMVDKILEKFPLMVKDVNDDEKKNIVLLAAEKRQTKVYQFLCENENLDKSSFKQVDENENTALHLAAKLGVNLNWQTSTMIEEFKWFEFVKKSMPFDFWERHNNDGKTAEEIFQDSFKEQMKSDREWLNQTSQACSVVSTLIASMAFTNVAGNFDNKGNSNILMNKFGLKPFPNPSLVTLTFSLLSTIFFLAILASRSQSVTFWRYVPFKLCFGMLFMFGSIVSLWISLMIHDHSLTTYAILGSPIAILVFFSLPMFIGPMMKSMFTKVPAPNHRTTSAIRYRRTRKKEKGTDSDPQN
ncbi:uncharacterized protein LOC129312380 isoform X2 [Prosopis cineraria]|uniref:uncharacterized protein LOC129312380 isoform X2 n=1 Tax=Prosopis cineraria TaxID=364024 RepID=UPI00240EF759|nr:uncharacterized protein LOC129312380 isoform X2 [Prosopis cineraria]